MPYINKEDRIKYNKYIENLVYILKEQDQDKIDGQVNYIITLLLKRLYKPNNYYTLNRCIGVLECIKEEYYRKVIVKYEEEKEKINGSVE